MIIILIDQGLIKPDTKIKSWHQNDNDWWVWIIDLNFTAIVEYIKKIKIYVQMCNYFNDAVNLIANNYNSNHTFVITKWVTLLS